MLFCKMLRQRSSAALSLARVDFDRIKRCPVRWIVSFKISNLSSPTTQHKTARVDHQPVHLVRRSPKKPEKGLAPVLTKKKACIVQALRVKQSAYGDSVSDSFSKSGLSEFWVEEESSDCCDELLELSLADEAGPPTASWALFSSEVMVV